MIDFIFPDFPTEFEFGTGKFGMGGVGGVGFGMVVIVYEGVAFAIFTHSSSVFIKVSHVADRS